MYVTLGRRSNGGPSKTEGLIRSERLPGPPLLLRPPLDLCCRTGRANLNLTQCLLLRGQMAKGVKVVLPLRQGGLSLVWVLLLLQFRELLGSPSPLWLVLRRGPLIGFLLRKSIIGLRPSILGLPRLERWSERRRLAACLLRVRVGQQRLRSRLLNLNPRGAGLLLMIGPVVRRNLQRGVGGPVTTVWRLLWRASLPSFPKAFVLFPGNFWLRVRGRSSLHVVLVAPLLLRERTSERALGTGSPLENQDLRGLVFRLVRNNQPARLLVSL